MCLVLAMNEASEASIEYDDIPYVSYEYPKQYRKRVVPGARFVYYRGRRRVDGSRQPQVYLGTGIIGDIRESRTPDRLVCDILDGVAFSTAVPFKDDRGIHLEPEGSRSGYWQPGVRKIPESAFRAILALGGVSEAEEEKDGERASPSPDPPQSWGGLYASAEVAQETERQSRQAAMRFLRRELGHITIDAMPTNNPGFDLETSDDGCRFVEIKGTSKPVPQFLLSEGERKFAETHKDQYLLIVVYGMDLSAHTVGGIEVARGPLGVDQKLSPVQWSGALPIGDRESSQTSVDDAPFP